MIRSSSQMCEPGTPGCASRMPIRRAQSTSRSRAPSRCGLSVVPNGRSRSGIREGPTCWYGRWLWLRARAVSERGVNLIEAADMPKPATASPAPPPFMYRLERMCHSWPPDCQSWSPLTYARTDAVRAGSRPLSAQSGPSSVRAVFSNCWSREVSRSLTASAAS
ncbi:hypothetical protein SMICM17S_04649 [Streptomyces microflavus]